MAVLARTSSDANTGSAAKLAGEVAKADPWAMINKIKDANTDSTNVSGANNEVGVLAIGTASSDAGARSSADLAAAVALKAMTKGGQFNANTDAEVVKGATVSAVNKVLGILDLIIRKTVLKKLEEVGDKVKEIQYSETAGEATQGGIT
ncbi:Variable major protein (plasmid) [Borrelia coriaceae ATCC 43381]|uniref:Variable large protein n=1 Tax=Borrelia coriaceae ATCC 43381 TaxID=1408429 RepID=W5SXL8_9SPIR|nr:Variable major protein [Borrelia coriaceae ATCC 43381]